MSQIEIICLVVVTIVVFFYGLAFFLSFRRSSNYQNKVIRGVSMDEDIGENILELQGDFYEENKKKKKEDAEKYLTLEDYRNAQKKKEKKQNTATNVISVIFYTIVIALFAMGIYLKVNQEQVFIGNSSYLVVETGSMSSKNKSNDYLFKDELTSKYTLDNQISTFDLIQLKKVKDEEIQLYDVLAYRGEDGSIIIHRVIDVVVNEKTGARHYRFRGDANGASSEYEYHGHDGTGEGLSYSDIIGRYTGWHSMGLGLMIDYIRSDIGIICLSSGIIVIAFYYFFDERNFKQLSEREEYVVKKMDEGNQTRYKWYNIKYRSNKNYKKLTKGIYIDSESGLGSKD